jgi:hypothetical protein
VLSGSAHAKAAWNIHEIDISHQFHLRSTYSFYVRGAQKRKKDGQVVKFFTLSESVCAKAASKYVGEIDPCCQDIYGTLYLSNYLCGSALW